MMETKFIVDGASVIEVVEVGDGFLVPAINVFQKKEYTLYESRNDARYNCMLEELKKGKDISNYKSSKYFKYYVERLKKEHPEYII
jgi:hypothetical protein